MFKSSLTNSVSYCRNYLLKVSRLIQNHQYNDCQNYYNNYNKYKAHLCVLPPHFSSDSHSTCSKRTRLRGKIKSFVWILVAKSLQRFHMTKIESTRHCIWNPRDRTCEIHMIDHVWNLGNHIWFWNIMSNFCDHIAEFCMDTFQVLNLSENWL